MIAKKSSRVVCVSVAIAASCLILWVQSVQAQTAGAADKPAAAQVKPPDRAIPFPIDPGAWVNSGPLTTESLLGKGVFVWFFEESCPTCRAKWPGILATAKKFEGQPVIFLAVNSGNPRAEVQQYAQELGISWPILVDSNRQYEQQSGVGEISLQNIYQAHIITADGRWRDGNWSDIEATVKNALDGAAWKVDPAGVPSTLRSAWLAIEFGNYAGAGASVKKGLVSPKADVKEAAEKLAAVVQKEIDGRAAAAKEALDQDKTWQAYELYNSLSARFTGFDLPPEVATNRKELAAHPQVKAGIVATKSLDSARRLFASGNAASQKRAALMLEKIVQEVPGTSLADQAAALLQQLGGSK